MRAAAGVAVAVAVGAALASAPLVADRPSGSDQPTFTVAVDGVRVDVLVTRRGRPVAGLTAEDFELRDNGVVQRITGVVQEEAPIDVILAFDASGSVAGEPLAALRDAAEAALDQLGDEDRAVLLTFSHELERHSPPAADTAAVRDALDRIAPAGATALRDAVYASLVLADASTRRAMVLVFSDGHDTASWSAAEAVIDRARATEVVVYGVWLDPQGQPALPAVMRGPPERIVTGPFRAPTLQDEAAPPISDFLDEIAAATGGQVFRTTHPRRLEDLFVRALGEMKSRYALSYVPHGVPRAGWHAIDVSLRRAGGDVTARPGYFVSEP